MKDFADYRLLEHNTFGIDVVCRRYLEFSSIKELQSLLLMYEISRNRFFVIGGGSNLLFLNNFDGYILHSAIKGCELIPTPDNDMVKLRCGSGEKWDDVISMCVKN